MCLQPNSWDRCCVMHPPLLWPPHRFCGTPASLSLDAPSPFPPYVSMPQLQLSMLQRMTPLSSTAQLQHERLLLITLLKAVFPGHIGILSFSSDPAFLRASKQCKPPGEHLPCRLHLLSDEVRRQGMLWRAQLPNQPPTCLGQRQGLCQNCPCLWRPCVVGQP